MLLTYARIRLAVDFLLRALSSSESPATRKFTAPFLAGRVATSSTLRRQNVLNNTFALKQIEAELDIGGILFDGIKECLIPCLKEGQTVVMDNAAFHKSKRTRELIEKAGCKLLYQPTYSPDLNPIEKQWAVLKRKYRKLKYKGYGHNDAVDAAFLV